MKNFNSAQKHSNINWQQQWSLFAEGFDSQYARIDLKPYGTEQTILLMPGAGFGDFSHPTTRLSLQLMAPYVQGKTVIDIGCGSGILSLAAVQLGASCVYGTDIDDFALKHATDNALLNGLEKKAEFLKPTKLPRISHDVVVVMNMISSEQQIAWKTHQNLKTSYLITSGILEQEHKEYLSFASSWGWKPIQEQREEQWKAYLFKLESP